MGALTALDVLVLLVVVGGAVLGVLRGFVSETMSLAAWLVAILAVKLLHTPFAALLVGPVGTEAGAAVLAFALLFGVTFLAVRMLGRALGQHARNSVLGPFDRLLGLGFGALKGLIGATLVFLFASLVFETVNTGSAPRPAWMTDSRSYPLLRATSEALVDFVEERRKA